MISSIEPDETCWVIKDCGLDQVRRVAEILALELGVGDCVCLRGDLGAGKTTFATFLLRAYGGSDDLIVPSPTFTLMERYEFARGVVHHADFYRLEEPDEAEELGIGDALAEGALLVEWAERAPEGLGARQLMVTLDIVPGVENRNVVFSGTPDWSGRISRLQDMAQFVDAHAHGVDRIAYLQGDASARRYAVLSSSDMSLRALQVLMDSPSQTDGPVIEDGRSYSAIAHLAEDVTSFVAVGQSLSQVGISVPEVYAHDLASGFLLTEHLGTGVFGNAIAAGEPLPKLYEMAVDVLVHLRGHRAPARITVDDGGGGAAVHHVPDFDWPSFRIETRLFIDWYLPAVAVHEVSGDVGSEFECHWRELFAAVAGHDHWVLRDFHSPNLIYRPDEAGLARVGVIDFQDAMRGHAAYDLVSLLQDARLDVPRETEAVMLDSYVRRAAQDNAAFDRVAFETAYAILGAQRCTKILGIFARLAHRDHKPQYLAHIPRIWGYLERNLAHDALNPLRTWYSQTVPDAWRRMT